MTGATDSTVHPRDGPESNMMTHMETNKKTHMITTITTRPRSRIHE